MGAATISNIDIAIVISYFAIVLLIGLWVSRRAKTSEDLFLGGRSFGWGFIGLSLFASNISSSTIIGLSGAAYESGIVGSVYEWMSGLPLIVAALVFIPLYLKNRVTTVPEYLEKRFDRRSQLFFSGVTIFTTIVIETAAALYAGSLVLQAFFPNLILWQTVLILALVAGIYTAFGGLKAVIYTDAIQSVILIIGCGVLTYILFSKLDFSWSKVLSSVPKDHFSVVRPLDDKTVPWPGLLVGVPFLGFWYWSTNQYIVQRILAARSINDARWGVTLAGFLKIIPLFIMVFPGAMAISIYPGIETADAVFPFLVTQVLPIGLVGLVLAGLVSAIMSSVDSALNSSSTLLVIDFIKPNRKNITEKEMTRYGRTATIVFMLIAALWAPQIQNFTGLWAYLQQMFSIIVPPIVVIFLMGAFYKRGTADASFYTLLIGTAFGIITFVLSLFNMWHLHFTINVGLMIFLSAIVFVVISRLTPPPTEAQLDTLTFNKAYINEGLEGTNFFTNYKNQMVALALLIFGVLIWLW